MSMYGPRTTLVPVVRFYAGYSEKLLVDIEFPPDSEYTDQSQKDDADINTIMNRYMSTGELPYLNEGNPQWADLTGVDFQQALHLVMEAEDAFSELPSSIRDRFKNDPGEFLAFTSDPTNAVEIAKMGLLTPEATELLLYPTEPKPTKAPKAPPEPE